MQGKINDFFSRDRKVLMLFLGIVIISILTLTMAYAALSVSLNIAGNAQVVGSTWDVHLDNIKVTNGSVSGVDPTITSSTTAIFSTTLNSPGDFYEFTIDVVNDGSIDAMIESITKTPTLSTEQAKYLNYIVEYQNGESINTKQLVSKNSFVRLKVRVEFRKDITASDFPTTSETLNLAFSVNYVQSDGSGSSVNDKGIKVINVIKGDGTKTSDEVCIGEECFYVMSSNDDSVIMLAKYNLYVGNECTSSYDSSCKAYGDEATGIQDSTMRGYISGSVPRKGTKEVSSINYWSSTVSSYPAYIYNENSTLYNYVENYKTYLESQGAKIKEARLAKVEELVTLGCKKCVNCSNAPSWVYNTSYWTGSARDGTSIYGTRSDGGFCNYGYNRTDYVGVRPVIVIDKSLL